MGVALKIFYAILISSLLGKGMGGCSIHSLKLTQSMTGVMIGRKFEYVVVVTNECNCEQGNINVNCKGFHTAKSIDPFLFKHDGADSTKCVLINGYPLGNHQSAYFKYVWDRPYPFTVVDGKMTC
ncbi:TPD1 protein homolog 1-like [Macadamia integrifolia]|uniref:TPD1 protein homolog 1-like n=1 Tax=Macadamia integrifolia TaxID=60698 RepID=UPI001C4E5CDC|nr:TPD1 protein homolog 1-like [Macadamia integrifolia]